MTNIIIKKIDLDGYGTFHIRRVSAIGRMRIGEILTDPNVSDDLKALRASIKLFTEAVVDENGNRVYRDDQYEEITNYDAAFIQGVIDEVNKLNPTPADQVKNSVPSPSDTSPSA